MDNLSQTSCSPRSTSSELSGTEWISHDVPTSDPGLGANTSSLSLAERVELNRSIIKHMLSSGPISCGVERAEGGQSCWRTHTGSESSWDLGVPADSEHSVCLLSQKALSDRHVRTEQLLNRARMNAQCFPLKADHNLPLYRDPQKANDRLRASPGVGQRREPSSSDSALKHPAHATSRVRFEDETENEAESRYQRRAERAQGVLVTRPQLSTYVSSKGVEPGATDRGDLHWKTPSIPCFTFQNEHIKETYIGAVTPGNTAPLAEQGGTRVSTMHVRRTNCVNRPLGLLPPDIVRPTHTGAPPSLELPPNPYAPEYVAPPTEPPSSKTSSLAETTGHSPCLPSKLAVSSQDQGRHRGADLQPQKTSTNPPCSQPTAEMWRDVDGQSRGPMREGQREDAPGNRDTGSRSRPSLRWMLSGLSGVLHGAGSRRRSCSLDQRSSRPAGTAPDPLWPGPSPGASAPVGCSTLRKTPSLQSLVKGSPLFQLRKTTSFQSLKSLQKSDPAHQPIAPPTRCLSVQDVGTPCRLRTVGRVKEISIDGTVLLELHLPEMGQYGFLIGRGQGHSGVYVEEMIDSSAEKLYSGLLSVGDEILEVSGRLVGRLSLDEVTSLLAQEGSASLRILPHRKVPQH